MVGMVRCRCGVGRVGEGRLGGGASACKCAMKNSKSGTEEEGTKAETGWYIQHRQAGSLKQF